MPALTPPTGKSDQALAATSAGDILKSAGPAGVPVVATPGTDYSAPSVAETVTATRTHTVPVAGPFHDRGGGVFNVLAYGLMRDGTTDNTAALNALLAAVYAAGGGVLHWPPGVYRIDGQITLPNDGVSKPAQPSITWYGCGAAHRGNSGPPVGGTILDMRFSDPDNEENNYKIKTLGLGFFRCEGITFRDQGSGSGHFFLTTNTTPRIAACAFFGPSTKAEEHCDQDALVFGGTREGVADGTNNSPFQGYASVIEGCYFERVRRAFYGRTYCNAVIFRDNTIWQTCGTNLPDGAAIEFEGVASNACTGNVISGNLIEMIGKYPYGIKLANTTGTTLQGNNFFDPSASTVAYIRLEATAVYNLILAGFSDDTHPTLSDASGGRNTFITAHQSQASLFPQPVDFTNTVTYNNNGFGPLLKKAATNEQYDWAFDGIGNLTVYYTPPDLPREAVATFSRSTATQKRLNIKGALAVVHAVEGDLMLRAQAGGGVYLGTTDAITAAYVVGGAMHATNGYYVGSTQVILSDRTVTTPAMAGGTAAAQDLQLWSTTHPTKSKIKLGANSAFDEANNRIGLGTNVPQSPVDIRMAAGGNAIQVIATTGSAGLSLSGGGGQLEMSGSAVTTQIGSKGPIPFAVSTNSNRRMVVSGTDGLVSLGIYGFGNTPYTQNSRLQLDIASAAEKGLVIKGTTTAAATISFVQLVGNVATITTLAAHNLTVGQTVTISGLATTVLNGTFVVSATITLQFSFAITGADIAKIADTGTVIGQQTANFFEAQNSAGAILSSVSESGYFTTRKTSAPADAELVAAELAYWFDPTPSAAKVMFKAKDSAGTVVTGSIPLAP